MAEYSYIDDQQIYFINAAIKLSCFIEDVSDAAEEKSMVFNMGIDICDVGFETYFRYEAQEI